jgi:ketosteroid isomerase-like protein
MLKKTLTVLATVALLGTACSSSDDNDATADVVATAEATQTALVEAFLSSDSSGTLELYTDDVGFEDPMIGTSTTGTSAMATQASTVFPWTDTEQTVVLDRFVSADGTSGVVVYRWVGTNAVGPFDLTMVQIHEYDDGLLAHLTNYYGDRDAAEQFGP